MRKLLLAVAALFSACGTHEPAKAFNLVQVDPVFPENHPEIKAIVDDFIELNRDHPTFVLNAVKEIQMVDDMEALPGAGPRTAGLAVYRTKRGLSVAGMGVIYLKRGFWEVATFTEKRILLWHECGHAYNNLPHTKDSTSIMSPTIPSTSYTLEHWAEMVRGFFEQRPEAQPYLSGGGLN